MAYDEELADRIRANLSNDPAVAPRVSERRMFGGLAFLIDGNMVVAASSKGGMMVRIDPADMQNPPVRHQRRTDGDAR